MNFEKSFLQMNLAAKLDVRLPMELRHNVIDLPVHLFIHRKADVYICLIRFLHAGIQPLTARSVNLNLQCL